MSNELNHESNQDSDLNVDEENVEALIKQLEGEQSEAEEAETEEEVKTTEAGEVEASEPEETKASEPEKSDVVMDEKVIVTRDGKHEIPYSVLANERARNVQLQRELEELKKAKAEEAVTEDPSETDGQSTDMDEDLEFFKEEFGEEAAEAERKRRARYAEMEKRQKELEQKIEENNKWREQLETKREDEIVNEVNEAIDSIPQLREWRDSDDPMWQAAVALDNRLSQDPDNSGLSFKERFSMVVERLTGQKPTQKPEQNTKAALEQKLAQTKPSSLPNSLSDIPGGQAPAQSETDSLEALTTSQLEAKFEKMTPEQQAEYLARL